MAKPWLSSLLRARQAQEDLARQRLAAAERAAQRARARVRYNSDRLDSLTAIGAEDSATAFVAAAVALQAAAATHSASLRAVGDSDAMVAQQRNHLGDAARARRTAEQLRDQELAAEQALAQASAQRFSDEVAARVHQSGRTTLDTGLAQ